MWTGRQTLASLENALSRLHAQEGELDVALQSATAEAERLRRDRLDAFKELARVKLGELEGGRLVEGLDAAERRAMQILSERRERLAEVTRRREEVIAGLHKAEAARDAAAQAVEQALSAVEELREAVEGGVQESAEWRAAKAAFDEADGIAGEAEKKAAGSEEELGAKQQPYDSDPLFAYLWERGYGTSRYSASPPVRWIDGMMARFIGFAGARANYAMLIEIPRRLREHAGRQRTKAEERKRALFEIERRALVAAGIESREQELAAARERLAAAEAAFTEGRDRLREIDKERGSLLREGQDPAYEQALSTIAGADAQDDIATLYGEARRTATPADEAIVRRIEAIDEKIARTETEIAGLRRSAQELARRRMEVESARDRFRKAGYDHPHTTFGNDSELSQVLQQILKGVIQSGLLWDLLRRGYGYRRPRGRPDFGFPFPFPIPGGTGGSGSRGDDWREPGSGGGWSPRDDDKFTTGGSF
jgi:chromosome segregation ATPase